MSTIPSGRAKAYNGGLPYIQWFASLAAPVQGAIISAIVAFVVAWLTHLRNTRPILIFIRRPDTLWRLKNIGKGAAIKVLLVDSSSSGKSEKFIIYPIADSEEVPLGALTFGDILTVYYRRFGFWFTYKTECKMWDNKMGIRIWMPSTENAPDETRLKRPKPPIPMVQAITNKDV